MLAASRQMAALATTPEEHATAALRESGAWDGMGRFTRELDAIRRGLQEQPITSDLRSLLHSNLANTYYMLGYMPEARAMDDGADQKTQHAQCSIAKLYASEMANRVADRAVQIFGGRGYMRENVAERFFREVRVERIWEGTSEIQRLIVADQLFKRGTTPIVG